MKLERGFPLIIVVIALLATVCSAGENWQTLFRLPGALQTISLLPDQKVMIKEELSLIKLNDQNVSDHLSFANNERCFVAENGACYAVIGFEGNADVVSAAAVRMYTSDGSLLWTMERHQLNDLIVLPDGGAVAAHRNINIKSHPVFFINSSGSLIRQIKVPSLGQILASPTGDRILINSGTEGAFLYDKEGDLLARLDNAYRMSFSDDGRYCALLYGPNLKIYHDGSLVYESSLGGELPRGISFNGDNTQIAAFTDHHLFLLAIPSGKVLLERQLDPSDQLSFTSVDLTSDSKFIAVGIEHDLGSSVKGPERHPDGMVRLYNATGDILLTKEVSYSAWNTMTPKVKFDSTDKNLYVMTRDEVLKTSVVDPTVKGGVR